MTGAQFGRLTWRAIEPFGAEVDFDFRQPLTDAEADALRDLLYDRQLILVRGQQLSLEQQQALAGYIGPVLSGGRGLAYVSPDDGILNETALTYHSDLAFAPEPFRALSLHAIDVADGQSATKFISAADAYQALSPALKATIATLQATAISAAETATRTVGYDIPADAIAQTRDIVMLHPGAGRPILYVNEQHTARIEGLSRDASDALLEQLFAVLYAPQNRFEHPWRNGDLILWDNLALQHGRPDVTGVRPRTLQRASVSERSLREQLPDFFKAATNA
jgi:taurine dioxygenase